MTRREFIQGAALVVAGLAVTTQHRRPAAKWNSPVVRWDDLATVWGVRNAN